MRVNGDKHGTSNYPHLASTQSTCAMHDWVKNMELRIIYI